MHPGDDQLYGFEDSDEKELFDIVDRIRAYTCYGALISELSPALNMKGYIEQGFEDMDDYLAKHAAFEEFMSERSETDA